MVEYLTKKEFRDFKNNDFFHLTSKVDKILFATITGLSTVIVGLIILIVRSFL